MQRWKAALSGACLLGVLVASPAGGTGQAQTTPDRVRMDADLAEVSVDGLHRLYAQHRYTVTEVTRWYLDRIERYNGTYRALLSVDSPGALAVAAREDAAPPSERHGELWGVPIVIKANTSVAGWVTSAGWEGYLRRGNQLLAPKDALVAQRLRGAGAIPLGHTNMPDFAASDTNRSTAGGRTGDAYDVRFSPGGSSGGTAMAVAGNLAVLGTGTDTANSIRQPAANNSLVGMLPTRGLTSIAGIHPLDWLRDNTGPLARDVRSAAIALDVMAAADPLDPWTRDSKEQEQRGPLTRFLKKDALRGKRFGVPAFMLEETIPAGGGRSALRPETRAAFLQAIEGMRAAGATVLIDPALLPASFLSLGRQVDTRPYRREGVDDFLKNFGPAQFHSVAEYEKATGDRFPAFMVGGARTERGETGRIEQLRIEDDPARETRFYGPQREMLAAYMNALKSFRLDGLVYPALQEPTFDETAPGARQDGPHSETGWVNRIGVPAISVPGGFYADGLPFGLEISGVRWHDGDLLGWAYAYEGATHHRRPPHLAGSADGVAP